MQINMIPSPVNIKVFRPAFSIKTREIMVIATFIPPIPRVADWASLVDRFALLKIAVEKKIAWKILIGILQLLFVL